MIETALVSIDTLPVDIAWLYCATLTYNNKYDWRFPTIYEFIYSGLFTNLDVWNIENVNNPHLPIRDIKR